MADNAECSGYSGGSLAGAIIGTFAATLLLLGLIYLVWEWQKRRRIKRSGLHNLVIVEDGGGTDGSGDGKGFAYDNPGFIDESTESKKSQQGGGLDPKFNGTGKSAPQQNGGKKMPWGPLSFLFKSRSALDDSVVEEPQKYSVALKGHDFTGLGFNICGNMRDGIFVKDIMQRGPAAESKEILPGDQITGMTVSFKQMVLEDAITLLSYASPYEVNLEMLRLPEKSLPHKGIFMSSPSASSGQTNTLERVCHPFFKSQSIDDLRKVGKEYLDLQVDRKKKQANGIHASKTSGTSATGGTIDIPTVVVVGNNENRSSSPSKSKSSAVKLPKLPKMNFSLGSSSSSNISPKQAKAPEAHQKSSSSAQIQIPIPDEIDGAKTPVVVSVTKPEIIPRTKTKSSNVQKSSPSVGEDMELVEAISPAIDKMAAEFDKNKKGVKESMQKLGEGVVSSSHSTAVLDVQPVEIDMKGQPTVKVESSGKMSTEMPTVKVDLPTTDVDVRAPSMIVMSSGGTKADAKECKKKEKSAGKQKSGKDIDITLPSFSLKAGSNIEMKEGESSDKQETKKPQRPQKSKDKGEKSKEKESKKSGKEVKEKDSSDQQQQGESNAGEKSKFFKFGIPVLPDISLNFGFGGNKAASTAEDKDKEKAAKESSASGGIEITEKASSSTNLETPQKDTERKKEKSPEPAPEKEAKEKDGKKEKEAKEKSSKSKDKNKEKEEKEASSTKPEASPEAEHPDAINEVASPPTKEKSGSSFSFNLKLPSFDKPLLKRKDSSSSNSGETAAEQVVDSSPNAAASKSKDSSDTKNKNDKSSSDASPSKTKKKATKEKKEKGSRPTSPEVSEGHRTTDDEADRSMDVVDSIPGEKSSKRGSGFHMPHIGIKLPKFGHSKQTYSFENAGDNKDLKHSHGPTAEALLEGTPSMKLEVSANTPEFRKMTPTQDDILQDATVKMDTQPITEAVSATVKNVKDEVDSSEVKVEIKDSKVTLPSVELPSASVKVEIAETSSSSAPTKSDEKGTVVKVAGEETTKKDQDNGNDKESPKDKESKPSFVSKGLKGLRDLKDKVAHKLSHDHQQHSGSSSEDEAEPGEEKATKESVKKEKKTKESKEKSKEEKQREKEEKAKEKERLKAEKKLKKAELKKKLSAAHSSSSSSSSSSSDESDADEGKDKKEKEKKRLKLKDKSGKEKKAKKEKKSEKSDKKGVGIEVKAEVPHVEVQTPDVTLPTSIEQKQLSGHEAKLIPAKPPVVPRKSRDSLNEESGKGAAGEKDSEIASTNQKMKLKKTKSKGASTSSSSSSSESDSENNSKDDKPKKPKRSPKRKAPEIPSASIDVPDVVKITTSVEVISPPREESGKKGGEHGGDMRESTPSKTPESGRRSASFGDLSSLQQPKSKSDGPLERAISMDMAGDTEPTTEPGTMPVGSSMEDLSVLPDSKTITHLSRGQQPLGLRDSIASKTSSSSNETLKSSPTSVVQVHPKEQSQQQELTTQVATTGLSQVAPVTTISVTATSSSEPQPQDSQSSTIQKMMNETWSVMNNIVHEMDSPSLVKSAMSTAGHAHDSKVTISTNPVDKAEAERLAQQTVDEIMVKANQTLMPEMSVSVNSPEQEPKVSVTTGDCSEPVTNIVSDLAHSLSADMEGGADSFSIASVKIQGVDGDNEEPISVRNITVTNIKNVPKPADADDADKLNDEEVEGTDASSDPGSKQLMREDSKARLLQTVADANEIKVAPATPLRKDSSLSSSSCSVDSSPDIVKTEVMKPNFSIEGKSMNDGDGDQQMGNTNGKTIEISSEELDGIMMSHADFLQKQAAVASTLDDSLDEPEQLPQELKDTFDSWVYVEQKNAAHEHTCPHSHSDPEPSTSSSNDDDDGPYSRNGALSPTTYRMETEYKFETSEMRVTSSPIPPEDAHVKSQSTVYSTTMTLPQKTVTQITLGDPVMDAGGRIVSKITLDTNSQGSEDANVNNKTTAGNTSVELPTLESLK